MISNEEAEVFWEFCNLTRRNIADYQEVDPPDYVHKDGDLAVEITQYHRDQCEQGSNARKIDELARKLAEQAQNLYEGAFTERLDVYIYIHNEWKPTLTTVHKAAELLAKLVSIYRNEETEITGKAIPPELSETLSGILIAPTPAYQGKSHWQHVTAALTNALPKAVQATLNKKEKKFHKYQKHARSIELLIYASSWPHVGNSSDATSSSCGTLTNELLNTTFETSFDKVFYLNRQNGELTQLTVKKPLAQRSNEFPQNVVT